MTDTDANSLLPAPTRLAVILASLCIAGFAMLAGMQLKVSPTYGEFIPGYIGWNAATKFQDLIAMPVFIGVFLVSLWIFYRCASQYRRFGGTIHADAFETQLLWWLSPAAILVGGAIAGHSTDNTSLPISTAALIFMALTATITHARGKAIAPEVASLAAACALMLALLPVAATLLAGRVGYTWIPGISTTSLVKVFQAGFIVALAGILVMAAFWQSRFERILPAGLLIGQAGLAMHFACFIPAGLLGPDGITVHYKVSPALTVVLVAFTLHALVDAIGRYRRFTDDRKVGWPTLLSPPALFAMLMALKMGGTTLPVVSADDYHFGEALVGWWSYFQGAIPYVDYIPPHGFVGDDLAGIVNCVFLDGTAASAGEAYRLTYLILAWFAYRAMARGDRGVGIGFASILLLSAGPVLLFLALFVCLWFDANLLASPARWLARWLVTVPVVILGVPAFGSLLIAASTPLAATMGWRLYRQGNLAINRTLFALMAFSFVCVAALTPLGAMLLGALRYVLENGPVNQLAYGLPWELSWNQQPRSGFLFELLRMSWVFVPVICLCAAANVSRLPGPHRTHALAAAVVALFLLLLIPYSMGRIDPGSGSRPAIIGTLAWGILLPAVCWPLFGLRAKPWWTLLLIFVGASLNGYAPGFKTMIAAAAPTIDTGKLRSGASVGMPNLGTGLFDEDHWVRLRKLNNLLSGKLPPAETYLDLTGRHAQYFYLARMPAMAVTAPYNLVAPRQQQRAVEVLAAHPPRVALLEGRNLNQDGGGLPLRNPLLYRFVLDQYVPALEDGFIIGYHKNEPEAGRDFVQGQVAPLTDINWINGVNRVDAALILGDTMLVERLTPGQIVGLPDGTKRMITIVRKDQASIWMNGPRIDPAMFRSGATLDIPLPGPLLDTYRLALLQKAFALPDHQKLPIAWGRSVGSLLKVMEKVRDLEGIKPVLHDLRVDGGTLRVDGPDPYLIFDIDPLQLAGRSAGILYLEFECLDRHFEPRIQLFWQGDAQARFEETASVRFTAANGPLVVALDGAPNWLALKRAKALRVDLDNPGACGRIRVANASLFQRKLSGL